MARLKQIKILAKSAPPAERVVVSRYNDDVQRIVEEMFARNCTPAEVQNRLLLDPAEAEHRYNQVLREYAQMADSMNETWARVEILRILKRAFDRREEIRSNIERYMKFQVERERAKGKDEKDVFPMYPAKEAAALREEDKLIYAIMRDFVKQLPKGTPKGEVNDSHIERGVSAADVSEARSRFQAVLAEFKDKNRVEPVAEDIFDDLKQATGEVGDD